MMKITLFSFAKSSASHRVRIALLLKGISFEEQTINLLKGEQFLPVYQALNPQHLVPTLQYDNKIISQSLAIIEFLQEKHLQPSIMPEDIAHRAYVRSIANMICCDIHPLNNLRVLRYLKTELGIGNEARDIWYKHWLTTGLSSVEAMMQSAKIKGNFCCGDYPTIADICLIPQLDKAIEMGLAINSYPKIAEIYQECMKIPSFIKASPMLSGSAEFQKYNGGRLSKSSSIH